MTVHFPFQNTYAALPANFFARVAPTPVAAPRLIKLNRLLARDLGLDPDLLDSPEGAEILSGKRLPDGADPIAMAYAGHQFGHFVPQLGDGRAILLGEVIDKDGIRRDIQLKGSGPTPFSRRGDGRAALGPVLREYIVSEAMVALGIPTTRSLAATITGESVMRETVLPGAVLTRVASSHIRVGTFQYFAARGDTEAVRRLADHVIARHYPALAGTEKPYHALLAAVVARQADLVARWLLVGFIHGVMNTDNTSISGETIDYGPCAFMDHYDPGQVFSSIDEMGRYAYANQPRIALWNLTRLAECLLPLFSEDQEKAIAEAQDILGAFPEQFSAAYQTKRWCRICWTRWRAERPTSPSPSAGLAMSLAMRPSMPRAMPGCVNCSPSRRRSTSGWCAGGSVCARSRNRAPSARRRCMRSTPPSSRATIASRRSFRPRWPMMITAPSKSSSPCWRSPIRTRLSSRTTRTRRRSTSACARRFAERER
jgi:uncharacterized protein YdiU (UPF0061 family)